MNIFDMSLPKEFNKNYLTNQNAMRVSRKVADYSDFFKEGKETKRQLALFIESLTNRIFGDCISYVDKIDKDKFTAFLTLCRKFYK